MTVGFAPSQRRVQGRATDGTGPDSLMAAPFRAWPGSRPTRASGPTMNAASWIRHR